MVCVGDLSPAAGQRVKEGQNILGRNLQAFADLLSGICTCRCIQRPHESTLRRTQLRQGQQRLLLGVPVPRARTALQMARVHASNSWMGVWSTAAFSLSIPRLRP